MAAPTQGPWAAFRSERFAEWIINQDGGPGYVCTVPWFEHRAAECDANAQLIASAWQMEQRLALLESLFERKWNGVVDAGSRFTWTLRGDWRHSICQMQGETFADAIDSVKVPF